MTELLSLFEKENFVEAVVSIPKLSEFDYNILDTDSVYVENFSKFSDSSNYLLDSVKERFENLTKLYDSVIKYGLEEVKTINFENKKISKEYNSLNNRKNNFKKIEMDSNAEEKHIAELLTVQEEILDKIKKDVESERKIYTEKISLLRNNVDVLNLQYSSISQTLDILKYCHNNSNKLKIDNRLTDVILDVMVSDINFTAARKQVDKLMIKENVVYKMPENNKINIENNNSVFDFSNIKESLFSFGYEEKQVNKLIKKIDYNQLNERIGYINEILDKKSIVKEGYKFLKIPTGILTKSEGCFDNELSDLNKRIKLYFPNN